MNNKKCMVCNRINTRRTSKWCSKPCEKKYKESIKQFTEKYEKIILDFFGKKLKEPETYDKIMREFCKRYKIERHKAGILFKPMLRNHFAFYPRYNNALAVMYAYKDQHEKARGKYKENYLKLPTKAHLKIEKNKKAFAQVIKKIFKMYEKEHKTIYEIAIETNKDVSKIREIIDRGE